MPQCFNLFACERGPLHPLLTQVLEGAFEVGPDLVQRPNLVSGVTLSEEAVHATYHIRPEARWSDGRPVTAADFQFSHRQYRTTAPPGLDYREIYRKIRRTWVLGLKTFRVEFREPYARWRDLYEIVLPRHVLEGHDLMKRELWLDRVDDPATGMLIGSGPFLLGPYERGKRLTASQEPSLLGPAHRVPRPDRLPLRRRGRSGRVSAERVRPLPQRPGHTPVCGHGRRGAASARLARPSPGRRPRWSI